jgi:hypothetical protein
MIEDAGKCEKLIEAKHYVFIYPENRSVRISISWSTFRRPISSS